jgi:hypothetical protein
MAITTGKENVMNKTKKLALAILATAALSGCATVRNDPAAAEASAAPAPAQVSRPAASYGSMGGYRYRRLIAVNLASSS